MTKRDLVWQERTRRASGFRLIEETKFDNTIPMLIAEYVGFWRSTSYGGAYARTLPRPEEYWNTLQSRFAAAASEGTLFVDLSSVLILVRSL